MLRKFNKVMLYTGVVSAAASIIVSRSFSIYTWSDFTEGLFVGVAISLICGSFFVKKFGRWNDS